MRLKEHRVGSILSGSGYNYIKWTKTQRDQRQLRPGEGRGQVKRFRDEVEKREKGHLKKFRRRGQENLEASIIYEKSL
jgi:hypothetical protein